MKIKALMVESLDGLISRMGESNIYNWTSAEDSQQFFYQVSQAKLILMGSQTYLAAKSKIKLRPGTLRVVLTHQPKNFQSDQVLDQLEFVNVKPAELIQQLKRRGFDSALLVGGSQTLSQFISAGLVNQLQITLEPVILGQGQTLLGQLDKTQNLKLQEFKQLNSRGTLLLTYDLV